MVFALNGFYVIWRNVFQNFPNTTHRFAARRILDNFELSLVILLLLPNTTTSNAITYANNSYEEQLSSGSSIHKYN